MTLHPLIDRARLESLIRRKRVAIERLSEKLADAELERQVLERELGRVTLAGANGAALAQAVEQRPRKAHVAGSSPVGGPAPRGNDSAEPAVTNGGAPCAAGAPAAPSAPSAGKAATHEEPEHPLRPTERDSGGSGAASSSGDSTRDPEVEPTRQHPSPPDRRRGDASRFHPGFIDETGKRHGRLMVLARAQNVAGNARWNCRCDCGETLIVEGIALRAGNVRSCRTCRGQVPREAVAAIKPDTTRRTVRCTHLFAAGLCPHVGCTHWDGRRSTAEPTYRGDTANARISRGRSGT